MLTASTEMLHKFKQLRWAVPVGQHGEKVICVFIDLVQENQILIQAAGGSAPSNLAYLLLQVFILPGPVLDIPGPALRGKDLCRGKNQRPDALQGL